MLSHVYALLRNIFGRRQLDQELDEELQSYIDLAAAEKQRRGMPARQAYDEARREFESVERVKEEVRDVRAGAAMDTAALDIRYAFRILGRNLSFSSIVVLTLALGIGANTAIFTVVNAVLLKPLPYPDPDRVVMIWQRNLRDGTLGTVAPANFYDWHQQNRSFDKMAAMDPYPDYILNGSGDPKRLSGANVSAEFFSLLGVRMALGRDFLPQEDRPGNRVVILSYSTWRQLGERRDIVGTPLQLNNGEYTVIGVLPRDFSLVRKSSDFQARDRFDVWTPLGLPSPPEAWQRGTHPLSVFGRLKPGIPLRQAQADLDRVAANLQRLYPQDDKEAGITASPLAEHAVENVRTALFTVLASVAMVLLIACANIANLLVTRAAARQKEIALRIALGASRKRIASQLLTESLVLAAAGGLLGLTLAYVGVPALVRHLPAGLPRTSEIAVEPRVLVFTALVSLLTGLVFGLVPLMQSRRVSANDSLKEAGRAVISGHARLRSAFIVGQVALALVLLMGAGLMAKSFWKLLQVSPGFQTERLLTARLSLPPQYTNGYAYGIGKHRRIGTFERTLGERVLGMPGVKAAAFSAYLPLSGTDNSWAFTIEGRPPTLPGEYDTANYRPVTDGYFETMGIPIKEGRGLGPGENEDAPLVVVINETMAHRFWSGQNPIGQRLRFLGEEWRTILGVVGDVHHEGLNSRPEPEIYLPYAQAANVEARPTIVVRTSMAPESVIKSLREAINSVDPNVPLDQIETMKQIVYGSVGQARFRTALVGAFALLALFVAAIGVYGVMSYAVNQRTREFGIRMAVGASRGAVLRAVLGETAKLLGIGIGAGLVGAIAAARLIASLLFGVTPFDAWTYGGVAILLAIVALAGSYVPARRAANADPMDSLRYE